MFVLLGQLIIMTYMEFTGDFFGFSFACSRLEIFDRLNLH